MFWNRLFLGVVGLFLAFSAGGKLQLWLDEGKVWYQPRGSSARLLSYDKEPFAYGLEIGVYIMMVLFGLFLVWLALGGSLRWIARK